METKRLRLRHFCQEDLNAFQAYRSDPDVARYQSWDTSFSRVEAEAFLAEMEKSRPDTPGAWFQFAVATIGDDRLIGDAALRVGDNEPDESEIGYSLASNAMGRGYASEAVVAILDYALTRRARATQSPGPKPATNALLRCCNGLALIDRIIRRAKAGSRAFGASRANTS